MKGKRPEEKTNAERRTSNVEVKNGRMYGLPSFQFPDFLASLVLSFFAS